MLFKGIVKNSGIAVFVQPTHIFHGKVPGSVIERHKKLHPTDVICPDILAHKFTISNIRIGEMKSAAIFDVKILRINKVETYYPKFPEIIHH